MRLKRSAEARQKVKVKLYDNDAVYTGTPELKGGPGRAKYAILTPGGQAVGGVVGGIEWIRIVR